eukprot:5230700-Pyramimonas_sp.AAC.1
MLSFASPAAWIEDVAAAVARHRCDVFHDACNLAIVRVHRVLDSAPHAAAEGHGRCLALDIERALGE